MRASHVVMGAALTCALATPAYAYLDPGTGSMILQGIIAGVAAGAAYVSIFWSRIKGYFSPASRSDSNSSKN